MTTRHWHEVKEHIDAEWNAIRLAPPDEVVRVFRYGIIESGAGTEGQCFSTWVFAEGDCRYLAFYGVNNLLAVAQNDAFTLEHLKELAQVFVPVSAEFLGYCGLPTLWRLSKQALDSMDSLETTSDFVELFSSLCLYCGTVNQWIQHYFPWNIGVLYPQRTPADWQEAMSFVEA